MKIVLREARLILLAGLFMFASCSDAGGAGPEPENIGRIGGPTEPNATFCGDGICASPENVFTCPSDCATAGSLISGTWFPIGPAPIVSTDKTIGSMSGRATVVAVNPFNYHDVWLGTANGGVWHTDKAGDIDAGWTVMTDDQASLAIGAIALADCDATRCKTVWIGTGENSVRRTTYYGAGLIRGDFQNLPPPPGAPAGALVAHAVFSPYTFTPVAKENFKFGAINNIVLRPNGVMYVTVSSGVTASMAAATKLAPVPLDGYGIHKFDPSATDNPATARDERWSVVFSTTSPDGADGLPTDLEVDETNGQMFAGIMGKGILRAPLSNDKAWCYLNPGAPQLTGCPTPGQNGDGSSTGLPNMASGGLPFLAKDALYTAKDSMPPLDHVELTLAPGKDFVMFGQCPAGAGFGRTFESCQNHIFTSTDSGAHWAEQATSMTGENPTNPRPEDFLEGYSRYDHMLRVHPSNPSFVYYGGNSMWESADGGKTFARKSNISFDFLHADQHDMVIIPASVRQSQDCPTDPTCMTTNAGKDLFLVANDGGFYFAYVTPGSFTLTDWQAGNKNLVTTQFYGIGAAIATSKTTPPPANQFKGTVVLGGIQDNGSAIFNGSANWAEIGFGDGGEAYFDGQGSNVFTSQTPSSGKTPFASFRWGSDGVLSLSSGIARFTADPDGTAGSVETLRATFEPVFTTGTRNADNSSTGYTATDAVWVDFPFGPSASATQVSPVFDTTNQNFPEMERSLNVITALAVGGSGGKPRIYVGLYGGQIFVSKPVTMPHQVPCADLSCWQRVDGANMPKLPVSSFAIDPANPSHAFVAFSGFATQDYVWTTDNVGTTAWTSVSSGLERDNPGKIIKIDPRDGKTLWLGTDHGVYARLAGDTVWNHFTTAISHLPNVPVYDIEIDTVGNRVFAATHGRGVWLMAGRPMITTFEGWTDDGIWDIPVYGTGFQCKNATGTDCKCTITVLRQDGTACAGPSEVDADNPGGNIFVQGTSQQGQMEHVLRTRNNSTFDNRPVVWACRSGFCVPKTLGGPRVDIRDCKTPGNAASAVEVACEGQDPVFAPIAGECPQQSRPPSNSLTADPTGTPGAGPRRADAVAAASPAVAGGTFVVAPTVLASPLNGGDHVLCGAIVNFLGSETPEQMQTLMRDAINASPDCRTANVSGVLVGGSPGGREDMAPTVPRLQLDAPTVFGSQLVIGVRARAGQTQGLCFTLSDLGVYTEGQLAVLGVEFETGPQGAQGGTLSLSERSPIGVCSQTIPTTPGESAQSIAAAVEAAFQAPGIPGPVDCPANQNPRDITRHDSPTGIVTVLPTRLRICPKDGGLGFSIGPHGVDIKCPGDTTPPVIMPQGTGQLSVCKPKSQLVTLPLPKVTDNCVLGLPVVTGRVVAIHGTPVDLPISPSGEVMLPLGSVTVEWKAVDTNGNASKVQQTIVIAGADLQSCCGANQTVIVGNDQQNAITPSAVLSYCVLGLGGGDFVVTPGGDDLLMGGSGADTLISGSGSDVIVGGDGADFISASGTHVEAYGGPGADSIQVVTAASSELWGGTDDDNIVGGPGPDLIYPGPGAKAVSGGAGDDKVVLFNECEAVPGMSLDGGTGNDTLVTPISVTDLRARGVTVTGFEVVIIDTTQRHLSECF